MEASFKNMYESAIRPNALRFRLKGRSYDLRHLFSGVESWQPLRRERVTRREWHNHPVYHVVLYTRGHGHMDLDGAERPFEPGLLVLTSPGQLHKFGPHEDCGCEVEYRNFSFDLADRDGRVSESPFKDLLEELWGRPVRNFKSAQTLTAERLREFLAALDAAMGLQLQHEEFPGPEAAGAVLSLLGKLFKVSSDGGEGSQAAPDERLLKAKSLVERDTRGRLGVEALAKAAGLSRAHFIRAFKANFGETPKRLSRKLRLERAKGMLACGAMGEKSIAAETGFCDEFHLSKLFKAEYGETPSKFRRKAMQGRS